MLGKAVSCLHIYLLFQLKYWPRQLETTKTKGISVKSNEIKISQYADDTTLILDGLREALSAVLNILDDFSRISGLRLNDKKTEALWIGSRIGNEKVILPGKDFKWSKNTVKTLGAFHLYENFGENCRTNGTGSFFPYRKTNGIEFYHLHLQVPRGPGLSSIFSLHKLTLAVLY